MKKFVFVLAVLCIATCLFVSCDTAADDDDSATTPATNSLIGTWVSTEAIPMGADGTELYIELIIKAEKVAIGISTNKTDWMNLDGDALSDTDYATYTSTDTTFTAAGDTYTYTISGKTLKVSGGEVGDTEVTFTKQ